MFFFRHPKRVTDNKEVAVLVQQSTTPVDSPEQVLVARRSPSVGRNDAEKTERADSPEKDAGGR